MDNKNIVAGDVGQAGSSILQERWKSHPGNGLDCENGCGWQARVLEEISEK